MYGNVSGDWTKFNASWATMEKYMIPTHADQPTNSFYNPSSPATRRPRLNNRRCARVREIRDTPERDT